jgi:hypothetical protein
MTTAIAVRHTAADKKARRATETAPIFLGKRSTNGLRIADFPAAVT